MTGIVSPPEFELFGPDDVESIDWADPVSDDPLNDGLEMWMLAGQGIPGGFGGDQWVDLTRKHVGTLTNMDPATDWQGTSRAGGFGALYFDGDGTSTFDHVALGSDLFESDSTGTIAAWVRFDSLTAQFPVISSYTGGTEYTRLYIPGADTTTIAFQCRDTATFNDAVRTPTNSISALEWFHVAVTSNGSAWAISINGVAQSLTVLAGSNSGRWFDDMTGSNSVRLANQLASDSSQKWMQGHLDDIRVYNRALSANEVSGLYHQSKEGHPDTLNRYTTSRWKAASAATTALPLMNHYLIG